jgi:transketolase
MSTPLRRVPVREYERVLAAFPGGVERTRAFAALTRINTLYMVMRAGSGHLGSSFSACDVVSHLLLHELRDPFDVDGDVYFSSKGHDAPSLYAAMIGLGRLPEDLLHRLRRLGGLPGHPDVHTPFTPFNTGSLGMGISKAKGLVLADRLLGVSRRVFVLTGDGELQEGQNWEALAGAAHRAMAELTVIVDHNKLQSDTWVHAVNDLGDLTARFAAFGWGVLRCNGNDPQALEATFRKRTEGFPHQPVAIIADTVKGAGCNTFAATSMAPDAPRYRFHSGAPADQDYLRAHAELVEAAEAILRQAGLGPLRMVDEAPLVAPHPRGGSLIEAYGRALVEHATRDRRIVALDADLVFDTGLASFAGAHPDRFIECGIAEQDMVSMASGIAARGLLPFVHSFSCFLHARPHEQIYNNATEERRIVYVGSLAGLLPASPGHSHQAVRDVSALAAVPGLVIVEPANPAEVDAAVEFCVRAPHSVYLRLASVTVPTEAARFPSGPLVLGRGRLVAGTGRAVALGAGPVVLTQLVRAAGLLADEGIGLAVVNLPWHNRIDPRWLAELAAGADQLIIIETQYTRGGQADMVARTLLESTASAHITFRGIGLTDVPRCGTEDEVLDAHGLSAVRLADEIRAVVRRT